MSLKLSPDKILRDIHVEHYKVKSTKSNDNASQRVKPKCTSTKKSKQWACLTRLAIISIGTSQETQVQTLTPVSSTKFSRIFNLVIRPLSRSQSSSENSDSKKSVMGDSVYIVLERKSVFYNSLQTSLALKLQNIQEEAV